MNRALLLFVTFVTVVMSSLALSACRSTRDSDPGTLVIHAGVPGQARTVSPTTSLEVALFRVVATSDFGETLEASSEAAVIEVSGVVPGTWDVAVTADNRDGETILSGSCTVYVDPAETTSVAVTLEPLSGSGEFAIELSWPDRGISDPRVVASLSRSSSAIEVPVICDATGCSGQVTGVPAGYHLLSVEVSDGVKAVTGVVETVRILAGRSTRCSYDFSDQQELFRGGIELSVAVDSMPPLRPSVRGIPPAIYAGEVIPIHAADVTAPGRCRWFTRGRPIGSGESALLEVPMEAEVVTVTVVCGDDRRQGSTRIEIPVIDEPPIGSLVYNESLTDGFTPLGAPVSAAIVEDTLVVGDRDGAKILSMALDSDTSAALDDSVRVLLEEEAIVSADRGEGAVWALSETGVRRFVFPVDGADPVVSTLTAEYSGTGLLASGVDEAYVFDSGVLERFSVVAGSLQASPLTVDARLATTDVRSLVVAEGGELILCDFAGDSLHRLSAAGQTAELVQVVENSVEGVSGLNGVTAGVAVGDDLYVCSYYDSAVVWFEKTQDVGLYVFRQALHDVCSGATDIAVNPDHTELYVTAGVGDALVVLGRDPETGQIEPLGSFADMGAGLDSPRCVAVGSTAVAVASANSGTVELFRTYRRRPVE